MLSPFDIFLQLNVYLLLDLATSYLCTKTPDECGKFDFNLYHQSCSEIAVTQSLDRLQSNNRADEATRSWFASGN